MSRPFDGDPATPHSILLTPIARAKLDKIQERTGLSRADIVGHLLMTSKLLANKQPDRPVWFPGKAYPPINVKLTAIEGKQLRTLARLSGHSWGEIVEALVRQANAKVKYPPRFRQRAS